MGQNDYKLAFNRGVVDQTALGRGDIKRLALSAEIQKNWMPLTMGPMQFRPGLEYITGTASHNPSRSIPFIFSVGTGDTAQVEFTDQKMRVLVADVLVTRASVSTAVTNGTFTTDLTGWSDEDGGTAISQHVSGDYLSLKGDGTQEASRKQTLSVSGGDQGTEHALRIIVIQGRLTFRLGSTDGGDEYISETTLDVGEHSLAFTPTGGSVYVEVFNRRTSTVLLDSIVIESSGIMELGTTLLTANLNDLRATQSGDVIFLACGISHRPLRVERRATNSWSIVNYVTENGPMRAPNGSQITMTPGALSGETTLAASKPYFKSSNVGSIFSINSLGQTVSSDLSAENSFTNSIRVNGVTSGRIFNIDVSGTWVGTITLQRSVGAEGAWTDVEAYTGVTSKTLDDTFDNQVIYYRLGIKTGDYTSGTATCELIYAAGEIKGFCRVKTFNSATEVDVVVLTDFGANAASLTWAEGTWSDRRGFPSADAFFGGRLIWAGKDRIVGTVVDDFENHDEDYVGDAGPINRTIGTGPVDNINWLAALQQLVAGAEGAEFLIRSSALEEPLTPQNFNLREATTYGASNVPAEKVDASAIFVDRTGSRIMETVTDAATMETGELTLLSHEVCKPYIVRIAVQRRPETMIHLVRSDGIVAVLVFDRAEEVRAFVTVETDGLVEDVIVIPNQVGVTDDKVIYTVKRTIDGVTKRYHEKWALYSEAIGGTINKMLDSFLHYTGSSVTTLTGLEHLEDKEVYLWSNGVDEGPFTVTSGQITGVTATTDAIIGLTYDGIFKSSKVGFSTLGPEAIGFERRMTHMSLMLINSHIRGLKYGIEAGFLDDLPLMEDGAEVDTDNVEAYYDQEAVSVNGDFTTDPRLYLTCQAPLPCTVVAVVAHMEDGRQI